uniref:Phospholipase D3 n=1 Tax=Haemonchus contortus TaxID=6289 RepID=A0A7I4Y0K6_HAECO|nr:Phospholipase D Transphosphatidylase and Phospholipase D viral envelope domain containing protein [Haemonchus contortus]
MLIGRKTLLDQKAHAQDEWRSGPVSGKRYPVRVRMISTVALLVALLLLSWIAVPFLQVASPLPTELFTCNRPCRAEYVESIPTGMNFSEGPVNRPTHEAWVDLLTKANRSIHIAALYWNLNSSEYPTAEYGRQVFAKLADAGRRGVDVRIAQDVSKGLSDNKDSQWLADRGLARVRTVDFAKLFGSGVLHTKFIIVDLVHVYIGSANMDWKSLAEVKELGLYVQNCPCLAADLHKIFAVYWHLGQKHAKIPTKWPSSFETSFNIKSPMKINLNGLDTDIFISSSPAPLNPKGRENDLETIVTIISSARRSVCVAVMDLIPQTLYMGSNNSYWPDIDDALRAAAFRGVSVKLLISQWSHSRPAEKAFLRSLVAINEGLPKERKGTGSISVKLFIVPSTEAQQKIPFARVNHNKYMVTDMAAYVGTSNWAGDYFISTAGVGVAMSGTSEEGVVQQLQAVFDRDWNSPYAADL